MQQHGLEIESPSMSRGRRNGDVIAGLIRRDQDQ